MKNNSLQQEGDLEGKGTHLCQIKVSKIQHERLLQLAESMGFNTVSSYIRFCCLNPTLQVTLNDIYRKVKVLASREGANEEKSNE